MLSTTTSWWTTTTKFFQVVNDLTKDRLRNGLNLIYVNYDQYECTSGDFAPWELLHIFRDVDQADASVARLLRDCVDWRVLEQANRNNVTQ